MIITILPPCGPNNIDSAPRGSEKAGFIPGLFHFKTHFHSTFFSDSTISIDFSLKFIAKSTNNAKTIDKTTENI